MSKVLCTEQREQAGSDSYNRFEYQVHWIVWHIIDKIEEESECIIFCEFHDDMAEFSPTDQKYQFFQIKTKEKNSNWTISEMSKREKNNQGKYKTSFLGFIFYNYLQFGEECKHCYFISNNSFDKDVLLWQAFIEDGKILQSEAPELYEKIKNRIKDEFNKNVPENFDEIFNKFIQNTFVCTSELQLKTYETQTMGKFFNHLADKNILANTANLIFQQLLNDVRKKSKEKIQVPISMKSLIEKKGVDIKKISSKIDCNIKNSGDYNAFHDYLKKEGLSTDKITCIESAKTLHYTRWLDVNDVKYQEVVVVLRKRINAYCDSIKDNGFTIEVEKLCLQDLEDHDLLSESLDKSLIEVLYYEKKFDRFNETRTRI